MPGARNPSLHAFVARRVQRAVEDHVVLMQSLLTVVGYAYIVGLMLQMLPWAVAVLRYAVAISVPGIGWTTTGNAGLA